ncbi:MAG TPA: protocatechuate 3,4-dioxygenase subunit alpha [Actinobacteria bacterium]|nr:protocatechuate 3,4-dioxygenase subunit alpha [Actinomycetota bacterium]
MSDQQTAPPAAGQLTPSQTVGPFLAIGLPWPDGPQVAGPDAEGAITISGRVLDGTGEPVPDALVETWQAAPDGSFAHPDDPRGGGDPAFRGFGRCPTDAGGRYQISTVRPGALPGPDGRMAAPHIDVSVFARGLLDRVVTRIYFGDEAEANAADPVLSSISDEGRRRTLVATAEGDRPGRFRFDIRLQGSGETVFFDV